MEIIIMKKEGVVEKKRIKLEKIKKVTVGNDQKNDHDKRSISKACEPDYIDGDCSPEFHPYKN